MFRWNALDHAEEYKQKRRRSPLLQTLGPSYCGLKPMTPKQFTAAIAKLGLSQVGAAKLLGITDRTARRYVAGDCEIPEPTAKLLRLALSGKITTEDIADA